ncbi:MAG: hypothetical protein SFW62_03975 [Alphaproteobacteria bacterium]|nr:hypothetical protein [Alphaproteobacteria bacterium]
MEIATILDRIEKLPAPTEDPAYLQEAGSLVAQLNGHVRPGVRFRRDMCARMVNAAIKLPGLAPSIVFLGQSSGVLGVATLGELISVALCADRDTDYRTARAIMEMFTCFRPEENARHGAENELQLEEYLRRRDTLFTALADLAIDSDANSKTKIQSRMEEIMRILAQQPDVAGVLFKHLTKAAVYGLEPMRSARAREIMGDFIVDKVPVYFLTFTVAQLERDNMPFIDGAHIMRGAPYKDVTDAPGKTEFIRMLKSCPAYEEQKIREAIAATRQPKRTFRERVWGTCGLS